MRQRTKAMDGTGNAAQIAAYIVQKNWGMLRGIFAGLVRLPFNLGQA